MSQFTFNNQTLDIPASHEDLIPVLTAMENQTTAAVTLYVSATGSDSNSGLSVDAPLATMQAAVNKLPKRICHPVTINVGAGTFAGAWMEGFTIDRNLSQSAPAQIKVVGTLAAATATTGTASGAVASAVAADFTTGQKNTVTKTSANWTTDDFRGKLLTFTSGALSGNYYPIVSNTATVLTVGGSFTDDGGAPAASDTFVIYDYATIFASAGFNVPAAAAEWYLATAHAFTWYLSNIGPGVDSIVFQNVSMATTGYANVFVGKNTQATFYLSKFTGQASKYCAVLGNGAFVSSSKCSYALNTNTKCFFSADETFGEAASADVSILSNNDIVYGLGTKTGVFLYGNGYKAQFYNLLAKNILRAAWAGGCNLSFFSAIFDTLDQAIAISYGEGYGAQAGLVFIDSAYFTACATVAVRGDGRGVMLELYGTQGGASNGVGVQVENGAVAQIASTSNIAGTNELQIDGTNYSLATLRAATPKVETDARTGSRIYQ